MGQLQVLFGRELVVAREHVVAVRAHVEVERGGRGLVARVRNHRVHVDVLEIVLVVGRILGVGTSQLGGAHDAVGNQDGGEELVLGTHPFQLLLHFLLVVAALAGIFHVPTLTGKLVVDAAVALLELLAELMTRDLLVPVQVDEVYVQRDDARHVLLHHLHAHHVAAGDEGVLQSPLCAAVELQVHHHGAVVELLRREVEVLGLEALRVVAQGEAVVVVALVKQHELRRLVGLIALQRCAGNDAALGAELDLQGVVLEGDQLLGARQRSGKGAVLGIHVECTLHGLHGQIVGSRILTCRCDDLVPGDGCVGHGDGAVDFAVLEREDNALVVNRGVIGGQVLQHAGEQTQVVVAQGIDIAGNGSGAVVGALHGGNGVDLSLTLGHFGLTGLIEPHESEDHDAHQQHSNQSVFVH